MRSQFSSGTKAMSAMASALDTPSRSMPLYVSDLKVRVVGTVSRISAP